MSFSRTQPVERGGVDVEMLRLAADRNLPADPEPVEVFVNRLLEFRPAAVEVDVLDAQQHAPAGRPRHVEIEQGGIGVAKMQKTVRGGREAECLVGEASRHAVGSGVDRPAASGTPRSRARRLQ